MKTLRPYGLTGAEVRALCVPGILDEERRSRIDAASAVLDSEEERFRELAGAGEARLFKGRALQAQMKDDVIWLYEKRLVGNSAGRRVYEEILTLAGEQCPLCHISGVSTLDHSFPKSLFPCVALEPMNLVPCCRDCNVGRMVGNGTVSISPYLDPWAGEVQWLRAEVIDESSPAGLRFSAARPSGIGDDQWDALRQFVAETKLADRYRQQAIDEFALFAYGLVQNGLNSEPDLVKDILEERRETVFKALGSNRWQGAAYAAWAEASPRIDWSDAVGGFLAADV